MKNLYVWLKKKSLLLKGRKYFSVSVDSKLDVNHTDQLTVIVRYVLDSGPMKGFPKFLRLTSHKGNLVLEELNKSNIYVISCWGKSNGNVWNMSGAYKKM